MPMKDIGAPAKCLAAMWLFTGQFAAMWLFTVLSRAAFLGLFMHSGINSALPAISPHHAVSGIFSLSALRLRLTRNLALGTGGRSA